VAADKAELEEAVEEMDGGRQGDRVLDVVEQREGGQEQGAEPEAREEGQGRGERGDEADDEQCQARLLRVERPPGQAPTTYSLWTRPPA
jgi:hypothetical protein